MSSSYLDIDPVSAERLKKRRVATDWQKCKNLFSAFAQGIEKDIAAYSNRVMYEESYFTSRMKSFMILIDKQPVWHKSCYASLTSPSNINGFKKGMNQKMMNQLWEKPVMMTPGAQQQELLCQRWIGRNAYIVTQESVKRCIR